MKRKQLFNHNEKLRFADRHYDKDLVIEMIDAGADPNSIIGYKVEGGGKKRRKISTKEAIWAAKKLDINLRILKLSTWKKGLNIELEHGKNELVKGKTNVTNNDILKTAKIALAHILEYPDYYQRLEKMEHNAEKYWKHRNKLYIFNH